MEELFRVGVISNTHGIRGEVKVYPTTDNVRRFDDLKEVILDTGKEQLILHALWLLRKENRIDSILNKKLIV